MAAYADYTYYTNTYKGNSITEYDFDRLILRASAYLDRITANRAADYTSEDAVKMAACAVAETWYINEQGGEIASQSVGSWSRHYAQAKPKSNDRRLLDAAILYLPDIVQPVRWV
jgi:hypothetical protein